MPRKKTMDEDQIRLEKIDLDIMEKKNCLGVKLVFNTPLEERYWHAMRTFYKINVGATGQTATRSLKNSWKGLVMLLLSLVYCKLGASTARTLISHIGYNSKKYHPSLSISWQYDVFLSSEETYKIQPIRYFSGAEADRLLMSINNKKIKAEIEEENKRWCKEKNYFWNFHQILP